MPEITKTLARCKSADFLRQANKIRKVAKDYYDLLNLAGIKQEMAERYNTENETEKKATRYEYISAILDKALEENAEKTVEIVGLAAFMTNEEAQELEPWQMMDILLECIGSERVMTFFIKMASLGGSDTESISQALISVRSIFSALNSSDSTLHSAANQKAEN